MRRLSSLILLLLFSPFAANAQLITKASSGGGSGGGGGGGAPGGSTTQFQYNASGSFAGAGELVRIAADIPGLIMVPGGGAVPADAAAFENNGSAFSGLMLADIGSTQALTISQSGGGGGQLEFIGLNGTYAVPTKVLTGDLLGQIGFSYYSGSQINGGPSIKSFASTDGDAATFQSVMFITANGSALVGSLSIRLDGGADTITLTSPIVAVSGVLNVAASGLQVNGVPGISADLAICTGVGCASHCTLRIASGVITNMTGTCPSS